MANSVQGKKVAIVATDGFEQSELLKPRQALDEAGVTTHVISLKAGAIKGWNDQDWGESVPVDLTIDQASAADYDGLLLPGGVMNPDKLRREPKVQQLVRDFFAAGKPVAAICHGPWTLIDAGVVSGRKLTSYHSIQTDLKNAGANWVDQEVVTDNGLVTSRQPSDIPAFNRKFIEELGEGLHERAASS